MELYFAYLSTYSQKVLLGFYEKGIAFSPHQLDLSDEVVMQEYRQLYPFGKVPLLLCDDGHLIPESSIILEYIDTLHDQAPTLIPNDLEQGRRVRFIDRMCDLYLNDATVSLIFESWKPDADQNKAMMVKASEKIGTMYRFLDDQLEGKEYLGGNQFSLADCSAVPCLYYAKSFAPFSGFENLNDYWQRVSTRPTFIQLKKEAEPFVNAALGAA